MTKFTTNKYLAGAGRQDYAIFERRPRWESSEKALADLWQRTARLPAPLVAQDGQRFRVLYPGRRSARAGPDFRDAILRGDDGRRVVGDVELHLRAPDWYSHSHHADPNYNGVVLHVVLRPRGRPIRAARQAAPSPWWAWRHRPRRLRGPATRRPRCHR